MRSLCLVSRLGAVAALVTLSAPALSCAASAASAREPASGVTVMAYNVLFKGSDHRESVEAIASEAPDVVCLVELTEAFVKVFEARFVKDYPHRRFVPKVGTHGVGIASRFPISAATTYPVAPIRLPAMQATLDVGGAPLEMVCVHLMPPDVKRGSGLIGYEVTSWNDDIRAKQGAYLVGKLAKVSGPALVLGDFNEDGDGPAITALAKAVFVRACEVAGECRPTFPGPQSPWPAVFAIDHVLGRGVTFTDAWTVAAGGSDHQPVLARLRLGAD